MRVWIVEVMGTEENKIMVLSTSSSFFKGKVEKHWCVMPLNRPDHVRLRKKPPK